MTALSLKNISKSFGASDILKDLSLTVTDEMRVGLVGPNGAGKTTLLRIICGEIVSDNGTVGLGPGVTVGYLPQETGAGTEMSVFETMLSVFEEAFALEERMRNLEHNMETAAGDPAEWRRISKEYESVTKAFEEAGGYGYKSAIKGVLTGLRLTADVYDRPVSTLSGGQRSRLNLAKLLLQKPSLLLLDEPTNHLDTDAAAWLEAYLKNWQGAIVIVSHDRWFLDELCTHIGEFFEGSIDMYTGNYSAFIAQRNEKRALMQKAYANNQKEIERQKKVVEQYYAWGRSGGGKNFIKAKAREKQLEKMERIQKAPNGRQKMRLKLGTTTRGGNDVLRARDLSMAFGEHTLFLGVNIDMYKGERAALVGPNGVGKTTLLRIIASKLFPTEGEVTLGVGIEVSYYDQLQETLDQQNTVLGELRDAYPKMPDGELRSVLSAFLFYGDDVFKKISALSGGEKGRLSLLKLMMACGNLLLLDEPTNHLDMDSREVLEDALVRFEGTVLFVSHDRYFINKVANRVFHMQDNKVVQYDGNWSDYITHINSEQQQAPDKDTGITKTAAAKQKRAQADRDRQARKVKKRVAQIEQQITRLEQKLAGIEEKLADPSGLGEGQILELSQQHADVKLQIEEAMRQWEQAYETA
ncbi:MAG: ribosomal protection-like ABC-F family protein [Christensenellales bacterium]